MTMRADIIADALRDLEVLGVGQSAPDASDALEVGKRLDRIYARLRGKGLTNDGNGIWDLTDIPPEYEEPLITMTASSCSRLFGKPADEVVTRRLESIEAENEIRKQSAALNDRQPVEAEYY